MTRRDATPIQSALVFYANPPMSVTLRRNVAEGALA
jgi:hypothetical protein